MYTLMDDVKGSDQSPRGRAEGGAYSSAGPVKKVRRGRYIFSIRVSGYIRYGLRLYRGQTRQLAYIINSECSRLSIYSFPIFYRVHCVYMFFKVRGTLSEKNAQ